MKRGTTPAPQSVDEYLAGVPEPARTALNRIRAAVRSVVPPETAEAIAYQMPTFRYKGPLVGFAAFAKHYSFFVMSSTLLDGFRDEIKGYQTATGTIRFPLDKAPPLLLIKKLVKARILENERRKP